MVANAPWGSAGKGDAAYEGARLSVRKAPRGQRRRGALRAGPRTRGPRSPGDATQRRAGPGDRGPGCLRQVGRAREAGVTEPRLLAAGAGIGDTASATILRVLMERGAFLWY